MDKGWGFFVVEIISLQLKIGDQMFRGTGKYGVSRVKQKMTDPQVGESGWERTQYSEPLNTNQSWSDVYATASLTHSHTLAHKPKALS